MEFNDYTDVKKEYEKHSKKYKLLEFDKLNEIFEIGKIENDEGTFLKALRKAMMEKIVNSLRFLEMLLNPMSAPRMYLLYFKLFARNPSALADG